ncbi:TfoX/Sxy family protein [Peteryoungia ipomoeae]|uniref:TfoX/Sxy family protein n=1 Tax=Peteryoungia ipomoeae TaxID=1210932 RepID=A0A4S8P6T5_9HYPH|nr:TfoX/Sxy family protein [Peteryoungia ipomoeae]THV25025.1 TfoX/Sxy family protein [Peteryoungia ipomoeae]
MDAVEIEEMFASLGHVQIKRMFGGKGIYCEGAIIAIDLFGEVMLKADEMSSPAFAEAGGRQWVYQREGKSPVAMPYWTIPETAYDDPDEMAHWVRLANDAGQRAGVAKPKKPKRGARERSLDDITP